MIFQILPRYWTFSICVSVFPIIDLLSGIFLNIQLTSLKSPVFLAPCCSIGIGKKGASIKMQWVWADCSYKTALCLKWKVWLHVIFPVHSLKMYRWKHMDELIWREIHMPFLNYSAPNGKAAFFPLYESLALLSTYCPTNLSVSKH